MTRQKEIKELLYIFENLGLQQCANGAILIGKAPHVASEAWLNKIYPVLNEEEITLLENTLKMPVPQAYKEFLLDFSNGLNVLVSTLSLDGLRKDLGRGIEASRQPYSLEDVNIYEKPKNAKSNYFFIGGYNWDKSHLYIDRETNKVHCCERRDATSKKEWPSLEEMIITELKRIYALFDEDGKEIEEDVPTIPY